MAQQGDHHTKHNVEGLFGDRVRHAPMTVEQRDQFDNVRLLAKNLYMQIIESVPVSEDREAALRKVREAVWLSHDAILTNGLLKVLQFTNDEHAG